MTKEIFLSGMTADQLKAEADTELDNIAAMGLNTVFLQVRPSADALYPSEVFPCRTLIHISRCRRKDDFRT